MRKIILVCVLVLATLLSGCGKGGAGKDSSKDTARETVRADGLLDPPVYEIEESIKIPVDVESSVYHVYEGKVYCIDATESAGELKYTLHSYDETGAVGEYPIDELKDYGYVQWCLSREDGKDILAVLSKTDKGYVVIVRNLEGSESKILPVDNNIIRNKKLMRIEALKDRGYVLQAYEYLNIISTDGKIEEGIIYKPEGYSIFASDKGVELMNGQTLYSYSTDTMDITSDCFLTDCKISKDHVKDIRFSQEKYYVLTDAEGEKDMTLSVLKISDVQERKEKIKLLLYQAYYPTIFQEDIDNYNFSNEDYEIILDSDRCDPSTRFIKETKPDIVILPTYEALAMPDYSRSGFFVDLIPFIDASEKIKADELNKAMVEAFSYNGKLYGLSEKIVFQTPAVYADIDMEGYNTETAVDIICNVTKEKGLESGRTANNYLDLLFTGILDDMVGDEFGPTRFNRQLVEDILVKVKNATEGIVEEDLMSSGISERDKRFLSYSRIRDAADISIMTDGYNLIPIGYPSLSGEPVYLMAFSEIMAVSSYCEHPEGAYEFIEYLMTRSELLGNQRGSIYSIDSLNRNGRYPGTEKGYTELLPVTEYIEGEEFEVKFNDENMSLLQDMTENVVVDSMLYWDVTDVIAEEAAFYFDGGKSLDEVMDIIENRVSIIMAENS